MASLAHYHGWAGEKRLTYSERILLNKLIADGGQIDHDTTDERMLVGCGYAKRHPDPLSGVGMIAVTDDGRRAALPTGQGS